VRQWALAVPNCLRYFLQRDVDIQGADLYLSLRLLEQWQGAHSLVSVPAARFRAVAFIHRCFPLPSLLKQLRFVRYSLSGGSTWRMVVKCWFLT
jgi:hypothetical protein